MVSFFGKEGESIKEYKNQNEKLTAYLDINLDRLVNKPTRADEDIVRNLIISLISETMEILCIDSVKINTLIKIHHREDFKAVVNLVDGKLDTELIFDADGFTAKGRHDKVGFHYSYRDTVLPYSIFETLYEECRLLIEKEKHNLETKFGILNTIGSFQKNYKEINHGKQII